MMFYTPHELQLHAQEKIREYEKQAELERLLKEAGTPSLRSQLAQVLQRLAVRLAPELGQSEPARSFASRRTSARGAR
jgi:hypothetical protein